MNEKVAIEFTCMVEWEDVLSPCRKQDLVDARTFYTVYWREKGKTFVQIGKELCRDHSSVMFLVKRHKVMMRYLYYKEKYEFFRRLVDSLTQDTTKDEGRQE